MARYEIYNLTQLQAMNSHLDDECYLMNDIDASETKTWNPSGSIYLGFQPIGDSVNPFTGSFDGGNFKITNLYINRSGVGTYQGLFGVIRSASSYEKITNGTFTGSATGWSLGTGWAYGTNNVVKSSASGSGTLSQNPGVVVGERYKLVYTILNYSAGSLTPSCGGVILSTRSANGTYTEEFVATTTDPLVFTPISDATALRVDTVSLVRVITHKNLTLENINYSGVTIGGYSGLIYNPSDDTGKFENVIVRGSISGTLVVGGFAGSVKNGTFTDCKSDGFFSLVLSGSVSGYNIGGFVSNGSGTYLRCSSDGIIQVSGSTSSTSVIGKAIGGFIGYASSAYSIYFTSCVSSVGIICGTSYPTNAPWNGIGGFVGQDVNATGIYTLCRANGTISFNETVGTNLGGFFGTGGTTTSVIKCSSYGNIIASQCTIGTLRAGGFTGFGGAIDSYSRGNVLKTGIALASITTCGGFAGQSGINITRCYSTGSVNTTALYYGGFIGNKTAGTTANCYWDIESSGTSVGKSGAGSNSGIEGKTTEQMTRSSTFVGYDFSTVWYMGQAIRPAITGSNITLWLSKQNDYDNFESGLNDNDSFSFVVPTQNEIRWLGALESLLLGTAGDEWKIGSNKLDTPLTPTNFTIKQQTEFGSSQIQPIKINSSLLFVDYVARKLREMTYVDPKYQSPDLTALAEHITKSGVVSIDRQKNPDSILWLTLGDGTLISMTYEREQNVLAWSRHSVGGNPYVQCVCVLPGQTEDTVYLSTSRTLSGDLVYYDGETVLYNNNEVRDGIGEVIYIEKMAPRNFENITDCHFVDCGKEIINSPASSVLTGLSHLDGETVSILGDGVVLDDAVVEDGKVTAKLKGKEVQISNAKVGLKYRYVVQPVRIVLGSQSGSTFGSILRTSELGISLLNSNGVKYGHDETQQFEIDFNDARWQNFSDITGLFTGEVVVSMPGGRGFDVWNPLLITGDSPLPCTVRAIIARLEKTGR